MVGLNSVIRGEGLGSVEDIGSGSSWVDVIES